MIQNNAHTHNKLPLCNGEKVEAVKSVLEKNVDGHLKSGADEGAADAHKKTLLSKKYYPTKYNKILGKKYSTNLPESQHVEHDNDRPEVEPKVADEKYMPIHLLELSEEGMDLIEEKAKVNRRMLLREIRALRIKAKTYTKTSNKPVAEGQPDSDSESESESECESELALAPMPKPKPKRAFPPRAGLKNSRQLLVKQG